jgi:hypothetical protein
VGGARTAKSVERAASDKTIPFSRWMTREKKRAVGTGTTPFLERPRLRRARLLELLVVPPLVVVVVPTGGSRVPIPMARERLPPSPWRRLVLDEGYWRDAGRVRACG